MIGVDRLNPIVPRLNPIIGALEVRIVRSGPLKRGATRCIAYRGKGMSERNRIVALRGSQRGC